MASPIKDLDKGWRKLESYVRARDERRVTVGVHGNKASRPGGEPDNVAVATIHEFGAVIARGGRTYRVPERSFIRSTVDAHAKKYTSLAARLAGRVLDGKMDIEKALALLGQVVKADIIRAINRGIEPALAPSTIAQKGSSKPLIDTGALKQSLDYQVVRKAAAR
jgi:phage gpG-like protein